MKKLSFTDFTEKLRTLVTRFPFPVIFIAVLAVLFFIVINQRDADVPQRLWAFFATGIPIVLMFSLLTENFKNQLVRYGTILLAILLLLLHVIFMPEKLQTVHIYQLTVIGLSAALACFVISFYRKNDAVSFWEFSKTSVIQIIISGVFAQVLMMGLSLAALALNQLFKIKIEDEVYQNLAVICYGLFMPLFFLANIPAGEDKFKTELRNEKFIKILGLYIVMPVLAVYTIILYVYFIQIIVNWDLPNGWVSWLVTVLALAGFITLMLQYAQRTENNKITVFFARYFPLILLPLLVLMSVGIFRRISDYGLTINRAYVLVFNFWLYGISIYLLITQSKYLKYIIYSFVIIAVFVSVGPWSVYAVTKHSLLNETRDLLTGIQYLDNGKMKDIETLKSLNISDKQAEKLEEKVSYLALNYGNSVLQDFFVQKIDTLRYSEVYKLMNLKNIVLADEYEKSFGFSLKYNTELIDVSDYANVVRISNTEYEQQDKNISVLFDNNFNLLKVKIKDSNYEFPLDAFLQSLTKFEENNLLNAEQLTLNIADTRLIFDNINFRQYKPHSKIIVDNFQGWLLIR